MDLRTVYLQELLVVSDILQIQRNTLRAMSALVHGMFGETTFASTLPPGGKPVHGTNLRIVVPAITLYQKAQISPSGWSQLSSDTTQSMIQGINFASTTLALTGTPDSALSIGSGNHIYYLVQGQLNNAQDINTQVLPYFPLIQTTTTSGSSSTVLHIVSSTGMSPGDLIIVDGYGSGTILTVDNPTQITLNSALGGGAPPTGKTVRDVTPNSGLPLTGPNNDGSSQSLDRVTTVTLAIKAGTAATVATPPTADSGYVPLFLVAMNNGDTTVTDGNIVVAPASPFAQLYLGAHHHRRSDAVTPPAGTTAYAGNAAPIQFSTEAEYVPLNKAGDTVTGDLTIGGVAPLITDPSFFVHASGFTTATYTGNGSGGGKDVITGSPFAVTPRFVIVSDLTNGISSSGNLFIYGTNTGAILTYNSTTQNIGLVENSGGSLGGIISTGFHVPLTWNQNTVTYRYFAWR